MNEQRLTINEIIEIASEYVEDYDYVGIRSQDEPFEIGELKHSSCVWVDGIETDDDLGGVCVTSATSNYAVIMHSREYTSRTGYYPGKHQAIICGNRAESGEDDYEIIISDPVVVRIIS